MDPMDRAWNIRIKRFTVDDETHKLWMEHARRLGVTAGQLTYILLDAASEEILSESSHLQSLST